MSKHDYRNSPRYRDAAGKLRRLKGRPLVGSAVLNEIAVVANALPELRFPINSAGDLLDQLGEGKTLSILDISVDPAMMMKFMPAYYFPIASYENLVERGRRTSQLLLIRLFQLTTTGWGHLGETPWLICL